MGNGKLIEHVYHQISLARDKLRASGSLCVKSGCMEGSDRRLWVHSEFGPAIQDKDTNQDYVIAWQDCAEIRDRKVSWAIVMSDGVTSSYWAEWAAELACWTSLARLVERRRRPVAKELALSSMHAAGEAIGELADVITKEPEEHCPDGEFAATWEYILSEGLLLQTTLTLVWWDGQLHIAVIGDGTAAIRDSSDAMYRVVAGSDLQTSRVHAIGPNNRMVAELDNWESLELTMPCSLAVFTDGVGRGVIADVAQLFACADVAIKDGETNAARKVIETLQKKCPKEFEDNLTLGLVYINR